VFEDLAAAIEDLDIPLDAESLAAVVALRDRLDARIAEAVGSFEGHGWWGFDGSASMTAWLRSHGRMTARAAQRLRCVGHRLRSLPVCARAYANGTRVVMAGRSAVLDYGMATRTIPTPLWNALVIRDESCRFPGCDRPPNWCEGHHVVWVTRGGPTELANLVLVCARHHHLLHRPGWHAKLLPDGLLEVTAPDGEVRCTSPPRAEVPWGC